MQEFVGGQLFVLGDPDFKPEKVTAYELGYRGNPDADVVVFGQRRSTTSTTTCAPSKSRRSVFLPLRWGNLMEGSAYGFEAWANLQVTPWWRMSPGVPLAAQAPRIQRRRVGNRRAWARRATIRSSQLPTSSRRWTCGASPSTRSFARSGALPDPALDDYTELNARVGWRASERLEVAVKGFNLLNETHLEYPAPEGRAIRRSVMAELRYSY